MREKLDAIFYADRAIAERPPLRRRALRHPCRARIRVGSRCGVVQDISPLGLAFQTQDRFASEEVVEVCLSFDWTDNPPFEVVQPARVIWTTHDGKISHVGLEFSD